MQARAFYRDKLPLQEANGKDDGSGSTGEGGGGNCEAEVSLARPFHVIYKTFYHVLYFQYISNFEAKLSQIKISVFWNRV